MTVNFNLGIMNDILAEINNLIAELVEEERFPAYVQMKEELSEFVNVDSSNKTPLLKNKLGLCIRLLMEAPPRNKEKGMTLLLKLDHAFKSID